MTILKRLLCGLPLAALALGAVPTLSAQYWWEPVHPFPDAGNYMDAVYGDGVWVIGGDNKLISTSDLGATWSVYRLATTNDTVDSVIFTGSRFIAMGMTFAYTPYGSALLYESFDGVTWAEVDSSRITGTGTANRLLGGAVSGDGQQIVLGGFQGTMIRSSDGGQTWVKSVYIAMPDGHATAGLAIPAVAYGNGKFVLSQSGYVDGVTRLIMSYSSNGGESWTAVNTGIESNADGGTFGDGKFVFTGSNPNTSNSRISTSTDGINWTYSDSPVNTGSIYDIAYGNGAWVGAPAYPVNPARGTDGSTFTILPSGIPFSGIYGVGFGGGNFVLTGGARAAYSSDGTTWTELTQGTREGLYGVQHIGGAWYALGNNGTILRSEDGGSTWAGVGPGGARRVEDVAFDGAGTYVAVGAGAWTSGDGLSWTYRTGFSPNLNAVAYGAGKFVAVGNSNTNRYSSDGVTWTPFTLPVSGANGSYIAYGNGVFVVAGDNYFNGLMFSSTDGVTWTQVGPSGGPRVAGLAFGNGRFLVTFDSGLAKTSTDGTAWADAQIQGPYKLAFTGDVFVALSTSNHLVFTSPNGDTWTPVEGVQNPYIEAVAASGDTVIGVASYAAIYRGMLSQGSSTVGSGIWMGAEDHGNGWTYLPWFGWFWRSESDPWVYHFNLGWLYPAGSQSALWLYSTDLGWLYTSPGAYPYLYSSSRGDWLWYESGSSNPRRFWDFSLPGWLEL